MSLHLRSCYTMCVCCCITSHHTTPKATSTHIDIASMYFYTFCIVQSTDYSVQGTLYTQLPGLGMHITSRVTFITSTKCFYVPLNQMEPKIKVPTHYSTLLHCHAQYITYLTSYSSFENIFAIFRKHWS